VWRKLLSSSKVDQRALPSPRASPASLSVVAAHFEVLSIRRSAMRLTKNGRERVRSGLRALRKRVRRRDVVRELELRGW
jgi:hypothetical protein